MRIETPKLWLPKTGQVVSQVDGDDGWFQAGNPRATRFIDNGNGTISDRATGLQWVKDPNALGSPFDAVMPWADAVANSLGTAHGGSFEYAGHADWRLPNIAELRSLTRITHTGMSILWPPFASVIWNSYYWSSSTYATTTIAWTVYSNTGGTVTKTKTDSINARPVRGGRING